MNERKFESPEMPVAERVPAQNTEDTPPIEVGKSYLFKNSDAFTLTANIEFISKNGAIVANTECLGEEIPGQTHTYTNAAEFFELYYSSEEGKKLFKEFSSKMYSKL